MKCLGCGFDFGEVTRQECNYICPTCGFKISCSFE